MASRAKQILDTAVDLGKSAVSAAEKRLRGDEKETDRAPKTPGEAVAKRAPKPKKRAKPSGSPASVGAAKPGKAGSPKSGTASTRSATERPPAGRAKAPAAKPKKAKAPRKRPPSARTPASEAAASSGPEVAKD
jgi:hypothetical protein